MTPVRSRSQRKREFKEIGTLVARLAELAPGVQSRLPLPQNILDLLADTRALKAGSRKRQLKYITKLLRDVPLDEIYSFMSREQGRHLEDARTLHMLEHWRDCLVNEALSLAAREARGGEPLTESWTGPALEAAVASFPRAEPQALARLAFLYARTRERKYSRELFRLLRSAMRRQQLDKMG